MVHSNARARKPSPGSKHTHNTHTHTGDEEDLASQVQLAYGTVGDDILDRPAGSGSGPFDPRLISLSPYFGHGGATDEPLYFGDTIHSIR